ncbi:hypothetical protein T02_8181 [Trichinella nativa]|uniref:Uncharacterized protein n=1 Tax=Trichinella nativa TaxID=6335 RepID=A0A0V1LS73_9BILA|nr:hypothetical protein T02_8181 [Trichinella nativa]
MKEKDLLEEKAKYLPSGYALGYASGKFFKKIAAGYAPGKIFALRLCSGLRLRQIFHKLCFRQFVKNICPQAMPGGNASGKIFAMPPANLKKYLPSGYTPGYASGKISGTHGATPPAKFFVIFEEIAPDFALRSAWSPLP